MAFRSVIRESEGSFAHVRKESRSRVRRRRGRFMVNIWGTRCKLFGRKRSDFLKNSAMGQLQKEMLGRQLARGDILNAKGGE
jgi:hypothetical protein